MSLFSEFFFVNQKDLGMGKIIPSDQKRTYLPFITANFDKMSQREIARRLGIGNTTVRCWSKELGFKFKKHTVNERFFDELNEVNSYLLGLIYADGNIAWNPERGYQSLTITASEKDKDHLENIRNLLKSSKPLLYAPKTKSYRLIVNNKKICRRLMELGVTPRKSLTVKFPEFITKEQLPHFLRGVIDGDGCVYYCKRRIRSYFAIKLASGSVEFITGLRKTIKNVVGIDANITKRNGTNVYFMEYTCARGKKLADYIYRDGNLCLDRKYKVYKENVLGGNKNGTKQ